MLDGQAWDAMCERRSRAVTSRWLGAELTQGTSRMLLMCLEGSSHGKRGCPRSDTRTPAHHGSTLSGGGGDGTRPPVRSSGPPAKSAPAKVALEPRRFRAVAPVLAAT